MTYAVVAIIASQAKAPPEVIIPARTAAFCPTFFSSLTEIHALIPSKNGIEKDISMIHSTTTRAGWTALLSAALFNRKAAALLATGTLLAAGLLPAQAATDIYSGQASGSTTTPITGNFTAGFNGNGTSGYATPTGSTGEILTFNATGVTSYTATDDITGVLLLNVLNLSSTSSLSETIAPSSTNLTNSLRFGGGTNTINQNGSGNFTISTNLSSTGQLTFNGSGTGIITVSGANSGINTAGVLVTGGTVKAAGNNAALGGKFDLLTITGGTVDLGGIAAGLGLQVSGLAGTGGTLTSTVTGTPNVLNIFGGTGGTYSGSITGNLSINLQNSGVVETLNGTNTYTGGTLVTSGILNVGEPGAGGTVTSLGSGSVTINAGGQLALNGPGGGAVNENVTNAVVLNGGTLLANDGYQHLQGAVSVTGAGNSTLITIYPGKDISVDGVLSGSGALTVNNNINYQYAGEGITHFTNAANTYTGTITSGGSTGNAVGNTSGGLISVDATNALQFASVVNNSGSTTLFPGGDATNSGTFQNLAGVQFGPSVTAATFGSLAGTGNFALVNTNATPAAVALTAGGNNASTTYSGIISGTGSLIKTGSGALVLSGADTYSGATTITAGTLQVGSGGATPTGSIASSSIAVGGGATLITASNGALSNSATAINLGDGNGSATVQNAAFTGATAANNIQKAGALSLGLGTANILDFAGNFGTFDFGSGAAADPGGNGFGLFGTSLNVRNFGTALNESTLGGNYQLLFDTALTTAQLGDISFLNSDSSQFGAIQQFVNGTSGQVQILEGTASAPEPAQTAALGLFGLGLGALVIKARKRSSVAAG